MPQNANKLRKAKAIKDDEFYTSYECAQYLIDLCLRALPKETCLMLGADTNESNFVKVAKQCAIDSM